MRMRLTYEQFDRRMLPIVCCLYVLSYLDRGNIGNAKTAGAQDDLGLSSAQVSRNFKRMGKAIIPVARD
jgi:hypothetical protein